MQIVDADVVVDAHVGVDVGFDVSADEIQVEGYVDKHACSDADSQRPGVHASVRGSAPGGHRVKGARGHRRCSAQGHARSQ